MIPEQRRSPRLRAAAGVRQSPGRLLPESELSFPPLVARAVAGTLRDRELPGCPRGWVRKESAC